MNSSKKYFKNLLNLITSFILTLVLLTPACAYPIFADAQLDEQALGNMMENLYANMTPAEQEEFAKEIEFQQQKIMQMSPEERDNYEKMMLSELDQLMATTPELFEKPQTALSNPEAIKPAEQLEKTLPEIDEVAPTTSNTTPKPKPITIPQELKDQSRKSMRNILNACDTILLKTNHMHDIMHASWNKGKWLNLKTDLQNLKSYLPMAINSNKILAELLDKSGQALMQGLKSFEPLIVQLAGELKTPDAMGLVTVTAGQQQIIDQQRYSQAVVKLKSIIDQLSDQLNQTKLLTSLKALLDKHAPQQLKAAASKKPKNPSSSQGRPAISSCKKLDQAELKREAQDLLALLTKSANSQLLDLLVQYQNMPSSNLQRKLQWKLSELEVYLERLVKLTSISTDLNCLQELNSILSTFDYALLDEIVSTLNLINSNELSLELLNWHKQLREFLVPAQLPMQAI